MKYYELMYDYEKSNSYVGCTKAEIGDISEYIVSSGEVIQSWNKDITFEYELEEGQTLTDYLGNLYGWLIVSDKCRTLSGELIANEVQYLDVQVKSSDNSNVLSEYKVLNVIDVLDAVDLEHSIYDEFDLDDEKILTFKKYALKDDVVRGHHIFKLKDDTIPTFVSEEIKNIIEENEMLGFAFLEVKTF